MCSYTKSDDQLDTSTLGSATTPTHIRFRPNTGLSKALDQVSSSEQHDLVLSPRSIPHLHPTLPIFPIQHFVKVVQYDGGSLVLGLTGFPWVDHEPCRGVFDGEFAHPYTMMSGGKTGFLVIRRAGGVGKSHRDDVSLLIPPHRGSIHMHGY
jgi:hypothetical protein